MGEEKHMGEDVPDGDGKGPKGVLVKVAVVLIALAVAAFSINPGHMFSMKPSGMSDDVYSIGREAYEIGELYTRHEIDHTAARSRLKPLADRLDKIASGYPDEYVDGYVGGMALSAARESGRDRFETYMDALGHALGY